MSRTDEVDERGPLLPLRTAADTTGEVQRLMAKFEARDNAPDIVREIANSPRAFSLWVAGIDALMYRAALPAGDREAVILRLAARADCGYAWRQHEVIAGRAGLTPEAIEAIGALAPGDGDRLAAVLTPSQLLAVSMADSVTVDGGAGISDETWAHAVATWGDEGAFDLLSSIAWWGGLVPLYIRMFRL
jgi:alkylhydroperoxidase family enzyme